MPTQKSFSAAHPAIVPVEEPVLSEGNAAAGRNGKRESRMAATANPYGQNNEQPPERSESAPGRLAYPFSFESKWIRLSDLKRNLFSYPDTDEQYPTLWSLQRAVLLQLLANPDPQLQAILAHPENTAPIKRLIGLEEFVIPEEESRTKQYREIAQRVGGDACGASPGCDGCGGCFSWWSGGGTDSAEQHAG